MTLQHQESRITVRGRSRISGKGVKFADFTSFFLNIPMKMKEFGLKGGFKRTPLAPSGCNTDTSLGHAYSEQYLMPACF